MTKAELESMIKDELKKIMTSPSFGFVEEVKDKYDLKWDDYCVVEIYDHPEDPDYTIVEVRADVDYDALETIGNKLDPIVAKVDKDTYFEPYTSGITRAYIQKSNSELKESVKRSDSFRRSR